MRAHSVLHSVLDDLYVFNWIFLSGQLLFIGDSGHRPKLFRWQEGYYHRCNYPWSQILSVSYAPEPMKTSCDYYFLTQIWYVAYPSPICSAYFTCSCRYSNHITFTLLLFSILLILCYSLIITEKNCFCALCIWRRHLNVSQGRWSSGRLERKTIGRGCDAAVHWNENESKSMQRVICCIRHTWERQWYTVSCLSYEPYFLIDHSLPL